MARYQQSSLVKPISVYAPAPLKYIDEAGQSLQNESDKGMLAVDELQKALNIKGGYKTQQRAKDFVAEKRPILEELSNELNQTGRINGGIGRVSSVINGLKADPEYQDIMADQTATASGAPDKVITQQGFNQHVQDIIDPTTGQFKQTKKGERYDDRWYNTVKPGDRNAERQPLYKQIKPVIDKIYSEPVTKSWIDENGSTHTQTLQEGVETESIRKEQVRKTLNDYFQNDPSIFNTQAAIYDKALSDKQGKVWGSQEELDATVDAFLGQYSTEKEIQKLGADKITRPGKGAGSGSGSGVAETGLTSELTLVLNNIEERGESSAVNSTVAAIQNGVDNKDGTYTKNATGSEMYLKVGTTNNVEKDKKLGQFIPIKVGIESAKSKIIDSLENLEGSESVTGKIDPRTGLSYNMDAAGNIHESELVNNIYKTKRIVPKDEYIRMQPEYQKYAKYASETYGIDIEDKDLNSAVKGKSVEDLAFLNDFNIKLSGIQGQRVFTPNAQNNITTTDDGRMVSRDNLTLSEEEAEEIFGSDGWFSDKGVKKLENYKLITKYKKEVPKDGGGKELKTFYNIPVHNVTDLDVRTATRSSEINRWGADKNTEDQMQSKEQRDLNTYNRIVAKKQKEKALSSISNGTPEEINQIFAGAETAITNSSYDQATKAVLIDALKATKAKPAGKERNEELYQINLRLTDPEKFYALYGEGDSSAGKSQGEWTKTPAKPLE